MDAGGPSRPFHWTIKRDGIIAPDERLPWERTIAVGLQHTFAIFGATVRAPILKWCTMRRTVHDAPGIRARIITGLNR